MAHIRLKTESPGPMSRRRLERRRAATPAGLARSTVEGGAPREFVAPSKGQDIILRLFAKSTK